MLIRLPRVMLNGHTDCARYMLMSDLHIGSAHMDRALLRSDLQWAKDNNARVFIAGDVFDLILPKDHKRYTPEVYCKELRDGGPFQRGQRRQRQRQAKSYAASTIGAAMRIRIGERVYRITRKGPTRTADKELDGRVDYDRRVIFIHPNLKGRDLLETLIHEGLHASFPQLSEDAVDQAAKEITRLARKFGFDQTE